MRWWWTALALVLVVVGCGGDDDDSSDAALVVDAAPVDATPIDAAPGLAFTTPTHDYGSTTPGSLLGFQWQLSNSGAVTTGAVTVVLSGPDAQDFNFGFNSCNTMTLAPGATCNMAVRFAPQVGRPLGTKTAFLDATAAGPGGSARATMTGTVVMPPVLITMPSSIPPVQVQVGQSGPQFDIVARNQSTTVTVSALSFSVSGMSAEFPQDTPLANGCVAGQSLAPGGSCNLRFHFAPTSLGIRQATVNFFGTTPAGAVAAMALLQGEGT